MGGKSPSFEERVNTAVNSMTQGEDGKWVLPEEVQADEALAFAVNAERRRRDTQSAYTRTQQENAQLKKQTELLASGWEEQFANTLPADQQAELEELKATDPDAWRTKLNEYEQQRRSVFKEKSQELATKAAGETELEYRQRALEEFQTNHPNIQLTDQVIADDIPPRITRQLEKGEINFATFLEQCADYLARGKVVAPPAAKAPGDPNLSDAPGGSTPGGDKAQKSETQKYNDAIF